MIAALWTRFQLWIAGVGALIVVVALAFWRGMAAGRAGAEAKKQAAREKALTESKAIDNETRSMDDAALDRDNARWLRK